MLRRLLLSSGVLVVLATAVACGRHGITAPATTSPTPGFTGATPAATPTAAEPRATGPTGLGLHTGAATGDPHVDVLVRVAYRRERVVPPAGLVDVALGTRIRVVVTSDKQQKLTVTYYPTEVRTVRPGKPASITFRANAKGIMKVILSDDEAVLVAFRSG
jgi:hypothetical protein